MTTALFWAAYIFALWIVPVALIVDFNRAGGDSGISDFVRLG